MTSLNESVTREEDSFLRGAGGRTVIEPEAADVGVEQTGPDRRVRPELSVVVPAYNEAGDVRSALEQIVQAVDRLVGTFEIVVVDDGSVDGTSTVLRSMADEQGCIEYVTHDTNQGKGLAIMTGCREVTGDRVLLMDADGDISPADIAAFTERMDREQADIVIGSKRHPDSEVDYPLRRRLLSRGYSLLVKALFRLDVTDTQVGMKLLRREVVDEIMPLLLVKRYAFDVELLAVAVNRGYTVAEAPVSIDFNMGSNVDWKEIAKIAWDTAAVFYRLHLLRYYDRVEKTIRP